MYTRSISLLAYPLVVYTGSDIGLVYPVVVHTSSDIGLAYPTPIFLQPTQFLITHGSIHSKVVHSISLPGSTQQVCFQGIMKQLVFKEIFQVVRNGPRITL